MKLFKRVHTIQASLLLHELSFVLLILITSSVAIGWAFAWQKSSEESLRLSTMNSHTQSIRGELYRQLKEVFDATFLSDRYARDEYELYLRRINGYLLQLKTLANAMDERQAIDRIGLSYHDFYRQTSQLLIPQSLSPEQKQLLDHQLEEYTFSELETAFSRLDDILQNKQQALADNRDKWLSQMLVLVPIPAIIAITLLLLSRRFVRANLVRPLASVIHGARRISKGDLVHQIQPSGVDDLARLARAINTMAEELMVSRDKLVEAKKQAALGELVPLVAHNIRNPLAGIRAAAQVTLDDKLDASVRDALTDIITAVDRLERWVTSLLTYLHPITPHYTLQSLCDAVDNALSLMQIQLTDKQIHIRKQGWLRDARLIRLDTNLIEQTVFNLLQNALEASSVDSEILLSYQEHDSGVELVIQDNGKGMRFDPVSEQVIDGEQKRLSCGLGIPFALKVIKQHGGQLTYDAELGQGTRATINLPVIANEGVQEP